jgi:hypothetical protein
MLRKSSLRKLVFVSLSCLFSICVMFSSATAQAQRGIEPRCQQGCLARHSAKMKALSEEYMNAGNKMQYQDAVEDEASRYVQCLTNCTHAGQIGKDRQIAPR